MTDEPRIKNFYFRDSFKRIRASIACITMNGVTYYGAAVVSPEDLNCIDKREARRRAEARMSNAIAKPQNVAWKIYREEKSIIDKDTGETRVEKYAIIDTHGHGSPYHILKRSGFHKLGHMPTVTFEECLHQTKEMIATCSVD